MNNSKFIPVNTPIFLGNEKKYLNQCIDSGWVSSDGEFVSKFEEQTASTTGRKFAVAVSSGTSALDIAVAALDLPPGSEVIVPSFCIVSVLHEVLRSGLVPVFVDCDYETFNVEPSDLISAITSKTKLIIVAHIYGLPVDMDPLLDEAKRRGIFVLEDASEVQGLQYRGKECGSFGDISTFSFYANKQITTGEGGMVLTDSVKFYERLKSLRNLCFNNDKRYSHERLGWNYRMSNLQAAVGLAQLENLSASIRRRREIADLYNKALADVKGITLPLKNQGFGENINWVYAITINQNLGLTAKDLREALHEDGIGTRSFFYPLHLQPLLQKQDINYRVHGDCNNSEMLYKRGLYLPSGLGLTDEEVEIVCTKLKKILVKYNE